MLQVEQLFKKWKATINFIDQSYHKIANIFISAQSPIQDIYLETKTLSLAPMTGNSHVRFYTNQVRHRYFHDSLATLG